MADFIHRHIAAFMRHLRGHYHQPIRVLLTQAIKLLCNGTRNPANAKAFHDDAVVVFKYLFQDSGANAWNQLHQKHAIVQLMKELHRL